MIRTLANTVAYPPHTSAARIRQRSCIFLADYAPAGDPLPMPMSLLGQCGCPTAWHISHYPMLAPSRADQLTMDGIPRHSESREVNDAQNSRMRVDQVGNDVISVRVYMMRRSVQLINNHQRFHQLNIIIIIKLANLAIYSPSRSHRSLLVFSNHRFTSCHPTVNTQILISFISSNYS